jgi:hypothetical protein
LDMLRAWKSSQALGTHGREPGRVHVLEKDGRRRDSSSKVPVATG